MEFSEVLKVSGVIAAGALAGAVRGESNQRPAETLTPLDRYVHADDGAFRHEILSRTTIPGGTLFAVKMVSQKWRTPEDSSISEWWHFLNILVPDKVETRTGLLIISGGGNDRESPRSPRPEAVMFALGAQSVVCELQMVPNQPVVFPGSDRQHKEDSFIAYTWDKFLRTGDAEWLARLPMTKSAVRAMDAVTEICRRENDLVVENYVVAGASKRGWTTWTTAAVDKRVVGIIPIVIDMLNVVPSFEHHYRAYGFFAEAVNDYVEAGIMEWQHRPEYLELCRIVEPFEYRDRLTMPKYIVNSAGDQFFLPDSSRFYFDDLKGEKHLRYVPNSDHSLGESDAAQSIAAYYVTLISGKKRPQFEWKIESEGVIRVRVEDKPTGVLLWQAANPESRDFRKDTIGDAWKSTPLEENAPGEYLARVSKPEKGWAACFVELSYPSATPWPMKFTSGVSVVPDVFPHPPFEPDATKLPPVRE